MAGMPLHCDAFEVSSPNVTYGADYIDSTLAASMLNETESRLHFARDRVRLVRGLSAEVVTTFEDGAFDWIYVDALHTHDAVL